MCWRAAGRLAAQLVDDVLDGLSDATEGEPGLGGDHDVAAGCRSALGTVDRIPVRLRITRTFACNAKLKPVLAVLSAISWPSSGLQTDFEHAWGRGTLPVG